jgi:hypothetical protein
MKRIEAELRIIKWGIWWEERSKRVGKTFIILWLGTYGSHRIINVFPTGSSSAI